MGIQPTMTRSTGGRLQQPSPRAFENECGSGESNPGFNHGKVVGSHCLTTAGFPRAESSGYLDVISVASRPLDRLGSEVRVGVIGQIRTGPYEGHDLACCTADTTITTEMRAGVEPASTALQAVASGPLGQRIAVPSPGFEPGHTTFRESPPTT